MIEFDAVHPSDRYRPIEQDPHPRLGEYRVADASALVGSGVWITLLVVTILADLPLSAAGLFLALGLLVVTPLAFSLVATRRRSGDDSLAYIIAVVGQPIGAIAAVAAFVLQPGSTLRAVLLLPWLAVGLAAAAFAVWRLGSRGPFPLPELAIDAALVAPLLAGAVLLLGDGPTPTGDPTVFELGAVHALFAGLVLPLVAGLTGRIVTSQRGRYPRNAGGALEAAATIVFVLTLPLLAIGALDDSALGLSAIVLLTLAAIALSVRLLTAIVPGVPNPSAVLLAITALALAFTVGLAPFAAATDVVDTAAMVTWHGTLGAIGVAVPALVAFRIR